MEKMFSTAFLMTWNNHQSVAMRVTAIEGVWIEKECAGSDSSMVFKRNLIFFQGFRWIFFD